MEFMVGMVQAGRVLMMNKQIDFKKHPVLRAYTLLVYWRFRKIDKELFGTKEYRKRKVEQIQESENTRRKLHQEAIIILKEEGFEEKEACKLLEDECERLVKEELRELKSSEVYCGSCRIILKRKDWIEHGRKEKDLHNLLATELMNLSKEQTLLKISIAEDNNRKQEKKNGS